MFPYDLESDLCMARIIAVSDKHPRWFSNAFRSKGGFGKIRAHTEKIDQSPVLSQKYRRDFRFRHIDAVDGKISQFIPHDLLKLRQCFNGFLASAQMTRCAR